MIFVPWPQNQKFPMPVCSAPKTRPGEQYVNPVCIGCGLRASTQQDTWYLKIFISETLTFLVLGCFSWDESPPSKGQSDKSDWEDSLTLGRKNFYRTIQKYQLLKLILYKWYLKLNLNGGGAGVNGLIFAGSSLPWGSGEAHSVGLWKVVKYLPDNYPDSRIWG